MRLFSYCIPFDDGAAPNPFWNECTLAICKPSIRRVAQVGDWVAGVGSVNVNGISFQNKLVYTMKITSKMTMEEYNTYCSKSLPNKIPDVQSGDYRRNVGDSIYDFSNSENPTLRPSVHIIKNRDRDLGGKNVLLSNHFYYFGKNAINIPEHLHPIVKQGQAHKSNANEPFKLEFIDWIERSKYLPNYLYGEPQIKVDFSKKNQDYIDDCYPTC
ncbi:MAG: hypothetical protein ABGW88_04960 [Leeuwenhoekiella sp.]|uniref:Nmad2 family putative nucleotide modification protein n=1 Tax=Leeuwenhoekiella sp. TaxID=1977054 RepID=UPI000EBF9783|nr:hypothetical protein [Leeuwenhoekiella sp.]|tara:strand:+ start:4662 stop:5303 length:642 start_codon:yes stop_codon:yes gene_type:complete